MTYPAAPWRLVGQMWVSMFSVAARPGRPGGVHGAAFVSYEPGSALTYYELLVARPAGGTRVRISDIWVDSPDSRDGGRELWAIPKELADLGRATSRTGPLARTTWTAADGGRPIASARFTDLSGAGPRLPVRCATRQPGLAPGQPERTAPVAGSARILPCRGHWDVDERGPLAWLRDARRLGSFRLTDFRLSFG